MNGNIVWVLNNTASSAHVLGALVEASHIAFDVTQEGRIYTVTLDPAPAGPAWWRGLWKCRTDNKSGSVQARRYEAADGSVALIGHWTDEGEWTWFAQLK